MQNELKIINQQEVLGKDFKVYGDWENPLFLAKDVAEWVDYSKNNNGIYETAKMLRTVDEDEKLIGTLFLSGQNREVWFLTEDGLYEVLMQSRKPIAKEFKKEVKSILKSIRKTGAYIRDDLLEKLTESEKTAAQYLKMLKAEKKLTKNSQRLIDAMDEYIDEIKPKSDYCESVLQCENTIPVSVIAKDYGMSAAGFNRLLYTAKIQYRVGGVWVLYSKYDGNGYTATNTFIKEGKAIVHTVWTQKGREFLYEKLKEYDILPEYETEQQSLFDCE